MWLCKLSMSEPVNKGQVWGGMGFAVYTWLSHGGLRFVSCVQQNWKHKCKSAMTYYFSYCLQWCNTRLFSLALILTIWVCFDCNKDLSIASPGVAERAEYHVMSHPQTFPRGLAPDYRAVGTTLGRRGKNLFTPQVSLTPSRPLHKATAVFGHAGGRLVVPNTGESEAEKMFIRCVPVCVRPKSLQRKARNQREVKKSVACRDSKRRRSVWPCQVFGLHQKCGNGIDRRSNMSLNILFTEAMKSECICIFNQLLCPDKLSPRNVFFL